MNRQFNIPQAVDLIREPELRIQRNLYNFLVQTKYLSESQIYTEAYLRGLVARRRSGIIPSNDRKEIDEQLFTDYQRFQNTGVDLTPIIMEFRPTPSDASVIIDEVYLEFNRLEESGADIAALGAQLEFGINVLKRTNLLGVRNVETLQEYLNWFNRKYVELSALQHPEINRRNEPQQFQQHQNQHQYFSSFSRFNNVNSNMQFNERQQNNSSHYQTPRSAFSHNEGENSNYNSTRLSPRFNSTQRTISNDMQNLNLSRRYESILAGPHRVSATIINILSKNVYGIDMDAIDQIETWENQASRMQVPTDYFLSYMEVLLSADLQIWWSMNRGN